MKRFLKFIKNTVIVCFILAVSLIVSGITYEKVSESRDSGKYPPPGMMVNVSGHDMHIYAKGSGDATVVFASGWGIECPYAEYYPIYSKLADNTRIAVYDRPGYGWSKTAGTSRDIDVIAGEVHELLSKSGEKPPYILVGHSLGSLELLRFAQLYGNEVKGIVMIDAGNPEYYAAEQDDAIAVMNSNGRLVYILDKLGVMRLLFDHNPGFLKAAYASRNGFSYVPEDIKRMDKALYLKNIVSRNKDDEIKNLKANAKKVVKGGHIGNIPLRILTAEKSEDGSKWLDSQISFKKWSNDSEQEVVKGTNHYMNQYVPDVITNEILELLKESRAAV